MRTKDEGNFVLVEPQLNKMSKERFHTKNYREIFQEMPSRSLSLRNKAQHICMTGFSFPMDHQEANISRDYVFLRGTLRIMLKTEINAWSRDFSGLRSVSIWNCEKCFVAQSRVKVE